MLPVHTVTVGLGVPSLEACTKRILHPSGAFTDAIEKCGYYAEADHSSRFIDEVASLSLSVQAKLLCVLDSGHFTKVGSTKELSADVRLLSAANEDLQA